MKLDKVHNVYFVGIGGIGMSALGRWFNANGFKVAGYDRTSTQLTSELVEEGIAVHFEDDVKYIPVNFNKETTLVVYTPAIPKDHKELNHLISEGYQVKKRSEVLGLITENKFTIAIAGTHGKTTTSSMVAHILRSSSVDCSAFLGGITQNYNTNLLLNKKSDDGNGVVVVEADEYDRSFLRLHPNIAVITSMDADHLDIYGTEEEFQKGFHDFIALVPNDGKVIYKNGLPLTGKTNAFSFGDESANYQARNIRIENHRFVFDLHTSDGREVKGIALLVPGFHNIQNALAAFGAADKYGVPTAKIAKALGTFKGVKRRFHYHVEKENIVFIDDYAHHPEEIKAFLSSVKALYAGKKVTAIFQPHLFSRTKDFMPGFAESLSLADEVILLDIYPAREQPIPGITSEVLLSKVTANEKKLASKSNLLEVVKNTKTDVLVTIGAGDIDSMVEPIKQLLLKTYA